MCLSDSTEQATSNTCKLTPSWKRSCLSWSHGFTFPQCRMPVCITMCSEAERVERVCVREREWDKRSGSENWQSRLMGPERRARNELVGRPTLNHWHGRADLPSSITSWRSTYTKRPLNPLDGVSRLEGSAVRQSNLRKPQPRQRRELAVVVQHATWGRGPFGRSFLPCLSTNHIPALRNHRARSIQHYHQRQRQRACESKQSESETNKENVQALTTSRWKLH